MHYNFLPQPRSLLWFLGCLLLGLFAFACKRQGISYSKLVNLVARNECISADLVTTPMLIAIWSSDTTRLIAYPDIANCPISDTSLIQLGSLSTTFLVPRLLQQMHIVGLTLDSVALRASHGTRAITFEDLLLHHSELPVYQPSPNFSPTEQVAEMLSRISEQPPLDEAPQFRFDHWNYTLASLLIAQRSKRDLSDLRSKELVFVDEANDSIRALIAPSLAKPQAVRAQSTQVFLLSTGAMASMNTLLTLVDSLSQLDLSGLPAKPTSPKGSNTQVTLGWFMQKVPGDRYVLTNAGRTRRHGAAMAYYPSTQTAVIVLAADSKPVDCLALDILRNVNDNWRKPPKS